MRRGARLEASYHDINPQKLRKIPSSGALHYNESFMPSFRIHRMRPHVKQNFRWAPHVSGLATIKPRDYETGSEMDAPNEYALWAVLRGSEEPLEIGDVVEAGGALKICKFVGFEAAKWAETESSMAASASKPN
jgi:hypothetical protein